MTEPRIRFVVELEGGSIGPQRAALLEAISSTGSISAAGRQLGLSFRRAWGVLEELNGLFGAPLVVAARGGRTGGGARLSPLGREVAALLRELEADVEAATETAVARLAALKAKT
jgi:molybdate transport system regulatory protein